MGLKLSNKKLRNSQISCDINMSMRIFAPKHFSLKVNDDFVAGVNRPIISPWKSSQPIQIVTRYIKFT